MVLFSNSSFGSEEEIEWIKLEKLSEVERLTSLGKMDEARMKLDGLTEKYPDYKEARHLYNYLQEHPSNGKRAEALSRDKSAMAGAEWVEFLRLKELGHRTEARLKLVALKDLFGDGGMKPEFLKDLDMELSHMDEWAEASLKNRLGEIRVHMIKLSSIEKAEERLSSFVTLYSVVREIEADYRGLRSLESLKEESLKEVEHAGRIVLAKADAVRRLEGCSSAKPLYNRLLTTLNHSEIGIYGKVKEELKTCEKE